MQQHKEYIIQEIIVNNVSDNGHTNDAVRYSGGYVFLREHTHTHTHSLSLSLTYYIDVADGNATLALKYLRA